MPRPARGPPPPTRMSSCARVGTRLPPALSRGGRKTGTRGCACCASGRLRRGRDRALTPPAGKQVLRACGAQDDKLARFGEGRRIVGAQHAAPLRRDSLPEEQPAQRDTRGGPEQEHPLEQLALQLGESGIELVPARLPFGVGLRQALLQLGVEPSEVQLVQLPEIGPIRGVDSVEPVHELVRDVLAELLIELLRKYRRDRHRSLHWWPVRNLAASQCPCVTVPLRAGTENCVKLPQSPLGAAAESRLLRGNESPFVDRG